MLYFALISDYSDFLKKWYHNMYNDIKGRYERNSES